MNRFGEVSDDLLQGAGAIAQFMFGNAGERRRVYHLADKVRLPIFRLGNVVCARKSTILAWIEEQERAAVSGERAA